MESKQIEELDEIEKDSDEKLMPAEMYVPKEKSSPKDKSIPEEMPEIKKSSAENSSPGKDPVFTEMAAQTKKTTLPTENPPPSAMRKPRLNRRGFHLVNNSFVDIIKDKSTSSKNGASDTSEAKKNVEAPARKIISLSSVKRNLAEQKLDIHKSSVKKHDTSTNAKKIQVQVKRQGAESTITSSCDTPAKKKHKPITWP